MKRAMRFLFLLPVALLMGCGCTKHDTKHDDKPYRVEGLDAADPTKAAQASLEVFKKDLQGDNIHFLGFHTVEEGRESKVGAPYQSYELGCDKVLAFDAPKDPDYQALSPTETMLFPIEAGGYKRSLITVKKIKGDDSGGKQGDWRPVRVGAPGLMGKIDSVRLRSGLDDKASLALVHIPAFGSAFLGTEARGEKFLTPLVLDKKAEPCMDPDMRQGPVSAAKVLSALKKCFDTTACREVKPPTEEDIKKQKPSKWVRPFPPPPPKGEPTRGTLQTAPARGKEAPPPESKQAK